jgi:uncharacterized protein
MSDFIKTIFNQNNTFFQLTKDAKRLPHIAFSSFLLPVLFVGLAAVLVQFILSPLVLGDAAAVDPVFKQIFLLFVYFSAISFFVFLWVKVVEGRPIFTLGFTRNAFIKKYLSGYAIGLSMTTLVVGTMYVLGGVEFTLTAHSIINFNSLGIVIIILFGFVVQGASEEILARGWMFQVIGARYKPWTGAVISSVFFSLLHLGNEGINVFGVVNLVLFAFLMVLFVLKDKSLWRACAWHSAWNWSLGNFYGLSVSGNEEMPSIINLDSKGSEIINGGGFGPEGSLITTLVLLFAVIYLFYKLYKSIYAS